MRTVTIVTVTKRDKCWISFLVALTMTEQEKSPPFSEEQADYLKTLVTSSLAKALEEARKPEEKQSDPLQPVEPKAGNGTGESLGRERQG